MEKIRYSPSLALLLFLLLAAACDRKPPLELGMTTLHEDTVWSGAVVVKGDIYIPEQVTLTIKPGTTVKFKRIDEGSDQNMFDIDSPYYPQAELIVRGKLLAMGTPKDPIVFQSAEVNPRPADWGALNFLGSDGNVIEHARVINGYNGVHAHGASVRIAHSQFIRNGVGVSFKAEEETPGVPWFGKRSRLTITDNLFANNKGGIGFRNSDAEISHNRIIDNKFFGIWPKENNNVRVTYNEITGNKKGVYLYQTRGVVFEFNNIYDNRDYNIAMAEAQDFPVEAPNNWFGTSNRDKIDRLIFDHEEDAELGRVMIDPILERAVAWEAR
ncbi:MAG: right-handed parallel beta-helix repeat-containing protein [Desulfurivibrionaceae bacterium]|nr:right-handed parallel beta-helix repeat-containing protein [Desulfobulbales bacterium]MDT8335250.1 right-handed parallel beta-helix repeat-containing protein [Desulfurivibrionaceae bacterium]